MAEIGCNWLIGTSKVYKYQMNRFNMYEVTFTVKSQTSATVQYVIKKLVDTCNEDHCYAKCTQFPCIALCYHLYSCTCVDYAKKNICKHLHKIHSFLSVSRETDDYDPGVEDFVSRERDDDPGVGDSTTLISQHTSQDMPSNDHPALISNINQILQEISNQLNHPQIQEHRLQVILQSVKSIKNANIATMSLDKTHVETMNKTDKINPGTLNTLQPRFHPVTKPSGRKRKTHLKAPTDEEKRALLVSTTTQATLPDRTTQPHTSQASGRRM